MSPRICHVHAKNASAASNVQDDLVLEDMTILVDSIAVGSGADIVFLHEALEHYTK